MLSSKSMAHLIKNIFAIIIALFVLATMSLMAQDKKCDSKSNSKCENVSSETRGKCQAVHSASGSKQDMSCSKEMMDKCCNKEAMNKSDKSSCCSDMKAKDTKESSSTVKPWNAVCPVRGNKVDPKVKTVEYKGKAYGFCCGGCDAKFKADPEKYSKNLSKDGKKLLSN